MSALRLTGEKLPVAMTRSDQTVGTGTSTGTKPPIEQTKDAIEGIKNRTFTGELLKSAGIGDDNLLARLLNTRMERG